MKLLTASIAVALTAHVSPAQKKISLEGMWTGTVCIHAFKRVE